MKPKFVVPFLMVILLSLLFMAVASGEAGIIPEVVPQTVIDAAWNEKLGQIYEAAQKYALNHALHFLRVADREKGQLIVLTAPKREGSKGDYLLTKYEAGRFVGLEQVSKETYYALILSLSVPVKEDEYYEIRMVNPLTNQQEGSYYCANLTVESLASRFASCGLSLFLPTDLPEGFPKDSVPDISVLNMDYEETEIPPQRTGEPDLVQMIDGTRVEHWKTSPDVFDTFSDAKIYFYSETSENWFGIIIRKCNLYDVPKMGNETIGQFKSSALEHEGEALEGTYHWRQLYLVSLEDIEKAEKGDSTSIALYEIMSDNLDMDVLRQVAEGMRLVTQGE